MAISRLQAALGMVTNEVTVAAAQINFDFTLVKNEAPHEYQILGQSLSEKRKLEAEGGRSHITARRLGALFDGICPPTPNLVKAYGTRVSETSSASKVVTPAGFESSLFAQYLGFDGTCIWAAATSSVSALQVQLLACMLARLFDASECTSIWVELVDARRKEIAVRFEKEESMPFTSLSAAVQAEIPRAHLAEWDAGARAWLRTADTAKSKEQKQLMLILDNLGLPVNHDVRVYSSVMEAWKASLLTMENLVSGRPQAIDNAAAILGLASWHIYPDMVILGSTRPNLHMNDLTVDPGGVLTVGMQRPSHRHDKETKYGIYWSLSLANLKYYGLPVLKHGEFSLNTSRISFNQFLKAAFGCLMASWDLDLADMGVATSIFIAAANTISAHGVHSSNPFRISKEVALLRSGSHWFYSMSNTARDYKTALAENKDQVARLIKLGMRRTGFFQTTPKNTEDFASLTMDDYLDMPSRYFGLTDPSTLLQCMVSMEDRIKYLRRVALRRSADDQNLYLIRFRWRDNYAFASAATPDPGSQYQRWYPTSALRRLPQQHGKLTVLSKARESGSRMDFVVDDESAADETVGQNQIPLIPGEQSHEIDSNRMANDAIFFIQVEDDGAHARSDFLFGDPQLAGLFTLQTPSLKLDEHLFEESSPEDILWCLENHMLSLETLGQSLVTTIHSCTTWSLEALQVATQIYQDVGDATIDLGVLDRPIVERTWFRKAEKSEQRTMGSDPIMQTREIALSCLAYFESGKCEVDPELLSGAFAMSSGDSLYISAQIRGDPWDQVPAHKFKRVLGNIGKTGITILVPPDVPMVRPIDPGSWQVVDYVEFNHLQEDHFANTSLHLSFTDYHEPIVLAPRGEQDFRVTLLESIISVHDKGQWVADIDILGALRSLSGCLESSPPHCSGHALSSLACSNGQKRNKGISSLENWNEVLDAPYRTCVARASNNSSARLAIAAVLVQLQKENKVKREIRICPSKGEVCFKCLVESKSLRQTILIY